MRLIDADKLIKDIPKTHADVFENCRNCELLDEFQVKTIISAQPTVEATPIRSARWVNRGKDLEAHSMEMFDAWSCSRCRYYIHGNGYPKWKYCPMCGCRMKGENE